MMLNSVFVFLCELFFVVILILFGAIASNMIAKIILKNINMFNSNKNSMMLLLSIILYLSIIVFLLYFIRLVLKKLIINDDLIESGFFIVGPIVGIFFLHKIFVKKMVKKYLKYT